MTYAGYSGFTGEFPQNTGFQRDYALYPGIGLEGMIDDSIPHDVITLINNAGNVDQVTKLTIGTAAPNTQYNAVFYSSRLGINPTTISYTSGPNDGVADIQQGLLNAFNAVLQLSGNLRFIQSPQEILFIPRTHGTAGSFDLSVSGGGTGYAAGVQTQPSDSVVIPFGRLLFQHPADMSRNCTVIDGDLTTGIIRGFAVRTEVHESPYPGLPLGYRPGMEVNCLTKGRIQIRPVTNMHPAGNIHVYITGVNQGRLRSTPDGSNTVQIPAGIGIRMYEPCVANQIGRVEVNLP